MPALATTPFKKAFENLDEERVSISPFASATAKFSPKPPAASPVGNIVVPHERPPVVAPKPISLDSLAPKPVQNIQTIQYTQKIPTQKNVADLKNALASILKKDPAAPVAAPVSASDNSKNDAPPKSVHFSDTFAGVNQKEVTAPPVKESPKELP